MAEALGRLAHALASEPDRHDLQVAYDGLLRQLSQHDPGRVATSLTSLGLHDISPRVPVGRLIGGQ